MSVLAVVELTARAAACDETEYREAAAHVAAQEYASAEALLRPCGSDPVANFLIGILPRFGEFDAETRDSYRTFLANSAAEGLPAAQAVHGLWLIDVQHDKRGFSLIESAADSGDPWAIWAIYSLKTASGERLQPAVTSRIEHIEQQGFPLADSILAGQDLFRTLDNIKNLTAEEQASAVERALNIAARGVVQGDFVALYQYRSLSKRLGLDRGGELSDELDYLSEFLSPSRRVTPETSNPSQIHKAHSAWGLTKIFGQFDASFDSRLTTAMKACLRDPLIRFSEICEIRSMIDHYVCMEPFAAILGSDQWSQSPAYASCRGRRLHDALTSPYY
jgi:hypothetical protein